MRRLLAVIALVAGCGGDDSVADSAATALGQTSTDGSTAGPSGAPDTAAESSTTANATSSAETTGPTSSTGASGGTLELYWVDTEGGAATVMLTPQGELIVVDAGNPGDRDADRIAAVITDEIGADHIDLCIVTHYDSDHVGGVPPLNDRVPIEEFWDHGTSVQQGSPNGLQLWNDYLALAADKRTVVAPGDSMTVGGVDFDIVSAHGNVITEPIDVSLRNLACEGAVNMPPATNENAMSVGFVATFGAFQFLDLGDLTWSYEHALACPNNLLGGVDLYQTTHHGLDSSGAPQLVHGVDPTVAVMNNGPHKGGTEQTFDTVTTAPSAPDLWALHRALDNNPAFNPPADLIANEGEDAADQAFWIHASVDAAGEITVTNARNAHQRTYASR